MIKMAEPQVSDISCAVLVFADIVDSSKFSSVLGFKNYAKRLIKFQHLFRSLGGQYFPQPADKSIGYCKVDARGDEGTIFCIEPRIPERAALVFKAIEFLYHLKARLYFVIEDQKDEKGRLKAPVRMGIGAGIHVGHVAMATELRNNRKEIVQIDGFSINKAKRVESASRVGVFSKIVLSKEAARILEGEPILLSNITASMKGIEEHAELYEVQSGLFNKLMLNSSDPSDEYLFEQVKELAKNPDLIDEPWLKAFVISALDVKISKTMAANHRALYRQLQLDLAWRSTIEDDPILLYLRAKYYQEQKKYTQQIRYLQQILKNHPNFVFAKKRLVRACWEIAQQDKELSEKVFARDVAEEFINKFSQYLTVKEMDEFKKIIEETGKNT